MILGWNEIQKRAIAFSKKWKDATDEFAEAQSYLNDFFDVFGVDRKRVATFETKVTMSSRKNGYIDLLWKGVILVEMKSAGKNLEKAHTQAKDYAFHLEDEELPEYIMVSDFKRIKLYNQTTGQEWTISLKDLHKKVKLFAALAGYKAAVELPTNKEVDIRAAGKMAELHDILKSHGYDGHELEVYLVRLLFCLFADDTGIFEQNIFFDYINESRVDGSDLSYRLGKLFEVLDNPPDKREKNVLLTDELKRFAYVNGSLFSEKLSLADFDIHMRKILLECATLDWGFISPAIFGSIFQGVMNPNERRELGAHYTSEENILKLINSLFLDELWNEFETIRGNSKQLAMFHQKLGELQFLDPACGCGNFLIITYRELRRLELEVLKMIIDTGGQMMIDLSPFLKVNVDQFYGIEIEEFPAQIAQVGMWLMDHQMNTLVAEYFGLYYARLPLRQSATIINGNALKVNWNTIISNTTLNYILGNPPFSGHRNVNGEQKNEMKEIFAGKQGRLDYVSAWYKKAAEYIVGTTISCAFVSTNTVVQGIHVNQLWAKLINKYNVKINFAHRTFKWSNDSKGNASVFCVIIGFANFDTKSKKIYYYPNVNAEPVVREVKTINSYLEEEENVIVKSIKKPLCNVPKMIYGNIPRDGGNYTFKDKQKEEFLKLEPNAGKYMFKLIGSTEYINNTHRWILFLKNCPPNELRSMPYVLERIEKVRKFRLSSAKGIQKFAKTPTLFAQLTQPLGKDFIIVPIVSSSKRRYIPIGFMNGDVIVNNRVFVIVDATLYHFGILTSNVHNSWMRMVGVRLKDDYSYSKDLVYNNFPWPDITDHLKDEIASAASHIIEVRDQFKSSTLADLYDPLTMPHELLKAHQKLDRLVMKAYNYSIKDMTEEDCVADLMERYKKLCEVNTF